MKNKKVSIARAIMYKELEKRREEREIECKRRGLWTLWKYQIHYKTLWHFLRANNERLLLLCDECRYVLLDMCNEYKSEIIFFEKRYNEDPCPEYEESVVYFNKLYHRCTREYNELITLQNKLTGGNDNENQN